MAVYGFPGAVLKVWKMLAKYMLKLEIIIVWIQFTTTDPLLLLGIVVMYKNHISIFIAFHSCIGIACIQPFVKAVHHRNIITTLFLAALV